MPMYASWIHLHCMEVFPSLQVTLFCTVAALHLGYTLQFRRKRCACLGGHEHLAEEAHLCGIEHHPLTPAQQVVLLEDVVQEVPEFARAVIHDLTQTQLQPSQRQCIICNFQAHAQ